MLKNKLALLDALNKLCNNTLMETLGIEFTDISENEVVARMPVKPKVHQPNGVLHGGASVALAESVGSAGTLMLTDGKDVQIRGIEISANHVKSVKNGYVYAKGKMVHKGRTIQLWHIDILNEKEELISFIKLTTITLRT
ncbi:PaaI family thioesterase [Aureisphaera sp. CAU 1614]|uniref:PaaI family thioesterase n=1 Tax=Halomarinibacterium sedimenti TaxID=2857106 RepID=A0A9X1FP43_9FLAO|nr:PaaI family thioesterase [Halomarinibacterium sedimenti]MBW2937484.1 PaaI family thioesterase [Halomarinibacterium sedimenti]